MIWGWIFSALIAVTLALCPDVITKPDFDLTMYVGDWYEIQRTDDAFQSDAKCVRARYAALEEPGTFSVLNSGVTGNGTYISIIGVGIQTNASEPASLTVTLPGLPPGSYLVLDTDYTSFATVYSCDETLEGKIEQGRLYSRNKTLHQDQIDLVMKDFADLGVNISQFQKYYQGEDCQYDAPPALCPDVKTKPDFDLSKYVGDWYEIQRIDAAFQFDGECVRARYEALEEPGTFSVLNTGVRGDGTYLSITGVGTQTNETAPGSLTVQFPQRK
ncbi:hypothetical protein QYM36_011173 [Artemia franciscana]|uniref:Lipocalin/cytosolic fatty-acid binding domain-containing protein n=1 Tax=Artemia franciscana TaxID=6661 RepID=A0AA88HMT4_ARTSF|nr:hypothetical protein QYM36_011173 [Artemia franciscana]